MSQGPWGSWNSGGQVNSGQNKNENPTKTGGQNQSSQGPWSNSGNSDSSSQNSTKYNKIIKDLMGGGNGGSGSGGGGGFEDFSNKFSKSPKKLGGLIALGLVAFWLVLGFYKVESDENAVVLYFGKFYSITTPGLNYHVPFPIGKVVKQSVTTVNTEEFTHSVAAKGKKDTKSDIENLMLTGDENIVDIEFQVQWQISNVEDFTFNISEPRMAIKKAAESAMREVIAKTPIYEALSDGKSKIEQSTRELLQQTLDSYGSGVRVILVQLRRVDPPAQVIDAFRDVQTAKADKEREINEAQAYANDIIPRARGNAAQMEEQANAYQKQVTADAEGEAKRFISVYQQYKNAREVTKKRMYLETMSKIYGDIDKVIIDKNVASGSVVPYFPLSDLGKEKEKKQ